MKESESLSSENIEKISEYLVEKSEFTFSCPYCGGVLHIKETYYSIPYLGRILIVSKKCSKCGYKHNDIIPLQKKQHVRIYIRVEKDEDKYIKVIRSNTASIEIPEIGFSIHPSIQAPMFITNIEGLLFRLQEAINRMKILEDDKKITINLLNRIPKEGFTVIIEDPLGVSDVLHECLGYGKIIKEYIEGSDN